MVRTKSSSRLIVRTPGIQGGGPVIHGTRLPVRSIALARDEDGLTRGEIADAYFVGLAEFEAALAYYDAHKAEIDQTIERSDRAANEV